MVLAFGGIYYGISKLITSIFKKITMRTQQDKVILDSFKKQLEKLYDYNNKIKLAKYIFNKLKIDKQGVEHFITIKDEERNILVRKFLNNYLPKGIKLDCNSVDYIYKLLYELALLLEQETHFSSRTYELGLFADENSIDEFIDEIIHNIDNYEYKNK